MKKDEIRTALITGAAEGVGKAYARYFAEHGYRLIMVSKNIERVQKYADMLYRKYGSYIKVLQYDLSEPHSLSSLLPEVDCHKIDVLVNNAAEEFSDSTAHLSGIERKRLIEVQINTTVSLTLHVLRIMINENRGCIINLAAAPSKIFDPQSSFCQSSCRMFICQFTEGLLPSLSGTGVFVQAVCPGLYRSIDNEKNLHQVKFARNIFCSDDIILKAMKDLEKGKFISTPGLKSSLFIRKRQEYMLSGSKKNRIS